VGTVRGCSEMIVLRSVVLLNRTPVAS